MANLNQCLQLSQIDVADAAEISVFIKRADGDPVAGVGLYLRSLDDEMLALQEVVVARSVAVDKIKPTDGRKPSSDASPEVDPDPLRGAGGDALGDDLFDMVPVGHSKDAEGGDVSITKTRAELAEELDAEDEFLEQLEVVCLK